MTTFTGLSAITGITSMVFVPAAAEQVVVTTQKSSGQFGHVVEGGQYRVLAIASSTGIVKVEWWDGTTEIAFTTNEWAGNSMAFFSKAISAPYDTSANKQAIFYSVDGSYNRSGNITKLAVVFNKVSGLDVSTCSSLTDLRLGNTYDYNEPISGVLDLTGCSSLYLISCSGTNLSSIDMSGVTSLTVAYVGNNESMSSLDLTGCTGLFLLQTSGSTITSLDVSTCSSLVLLYCGSSALTSLTVGSIPNLEVLSISAAGITSLDVTGCSSLYILWLSSLPSITSLSLNGLANLDQVSCLNCSSLSSIRAVGVGGTMYGYYSSYSMVTGGFILRNCNLDEAALDQLYTDLSSTDGATIIVNGNPGAGFDNPSIATAKGYTVMGSVPLVDQVVFTTTLSSGTFGLTYTQQVTNVMTTTGRCKVTWWDGSSQQFGSGNPLQPMQIFKDIQSPYNNSNSKTVTVISSDENHDPSGHIRQIGIGNNNKVQSFDASGCSYLTTLTIGGSVGAGITNANLTFPSNPYMTSVVIVNHPIGGTLDFTNQKNLVGINVLACQLEGLVLSGCTGITDLNASLNAFTSLAVGDLTSLVNLNLRGGALTSIDLSGLSNLYSCYLQENSNLGSVAAIGVGGGMGSPYYYSQSYLPSGINVSYCNLNAAALNQLYTDLSSTTGAVLLVSENPGVSSDTPSIATAKGYTVVGS